MNPYLAMRERAQAFVDRKYTASADARQKEMRLSYVIAERQDLAKEMTAFAALEVREAIGTKASKTRVFICDTCGKPPDCPMLHDPQWRKIGGPHALACIECAEKKLERRLTLNDLRPCPGNAATILMVKRATSKI